MNTTAMDLGVYRMMQGHLNGFANHNAAQTNHEITQALTAPISSGSTQGMAFALQREQALTGTASPQETPPYEPVLEVRDAISSGDITQINANSIDMSRYIQSVMSGNVEGPVPMSALLARENYERAMGILS
ncbi:hypothetical protein MHM88_09605 [Epibacterium sp. MM17-32]|uniref:hypothetical protein n=1 Tax=Epibacterium sp. MM17-32 TaxID=2917734 RepID=UPI001EF6B714|nr:hypothetical protein [Epibacterium sp. MM17-32]MCG7628060.1 hypothetical protein [Epibacterium sp. MM17-32]